MGRTTHSFFRPAGAIPPKPFRTQSSCSSKGWGMTCRRRLKAVLRKQSMATRSLRACTGTDCAANMKEAARGRLLRLRQERGLDRQRRDRLQALGDVLAHRAFDGEAQAGRADKRVAHLRRVLR